MSELLQGFMTPYARLWLSAFLITQLIEVSLGWLVLWRLNRHRPDPMPLTPLRLTLVLFMASALTHPPLWFVLVKLRRWGFSYEQYVLIGELFAWLTEALWYKLTLRPLKRRLSLALLLSLALNSASYLIGLSL